VGGITADGLTVILNRPLIFALLAIAETTIVVKVGVGRQELNGTV